MKIQLFSTLVLGAFLTACSCCDSPPPQPVVEQQECVPAIGCVEDFCKNVGDRVYFDFDKSKVLPCGQDTLRRQAEWLNKNTQFTATIAGHCDERGSTDYNLALGERRANAAKKLLIEYGVSPSRLNVCSLGKERPIVAGSNERAWQENRVAITVLSGSEACSPCPSQCDTPIEPVPMQ